MLLKGKSFWNVERIEADGLSDLGDILRSGITGMEYKPKTVFPDDENRIGERELLLSRQRKDEIALNRLRSLFLFADSDMSEKEYYLQRQELLDDIAETKARLEKIVGENAEPQTTDQEFLDQASYFIMVQALLGEKEIDYEKYIRGIAPEIPRSFIKKIISKIELLDGNVSSITFSNVIKICFVYKK